MSKKIKRISNLNKKLNNIALHSKVRDTEKCLEALFANAELKYICNQAYRDDFIENMLLEMSKPVCKSLRHKRDDKTVLFYDGFGADNRGLAQIYLKALVKLDYQVVYVTRAATEAYQPLVMAILRQGKTKVYHDTSNVITDRIGFLKNICNHEKFSTAFFYTSPQDISGTIVFDALKGTCNRYQINLTDQAFWLGINAFDYCIEFRDYGAGITHYERGISSDRLLYLPYYAIVNKDITFQGFPFETEGKKVIFSGGAIYKTIDRELTYYHLVEDIVKNHQDVIFVYAGGKGEEYASHIDGLSKKYPGRIYHIEERIDLYQVLCHSYLYLNTYPISGALMLMYAVMAECIPVTLRRSWDDDASGILMHEDTLGETFCDYDKALAEIDSLLTDEKYYISKKALLNDMVITEEEFTEGLQKIITAPEEMVMPNPHRYDTRFFRNAYLERIGERDFATAIISKYTKKIWPDFPVYLIQRCITKIGKTIRK